jgi:hypothetical protein
MTTAIGRLMAITSRHNYCFYCNVISKVQAWPTNIVLSNYKLGYHWDSVGSKRLSITLAHSLEEPLHAVVMQGFVMARSPMAIVGPARPGVRRTQWPQPPDPRISTMTSVSRRLPRQTCCSPRRPREAWSQIPGSCCNKACVRGFGIRIQYCAQLFQHVARYQSLGAVQRHKEIHTSTCSRPKARPGQQAQSAPKGWRREAVSGTAMTAGGYRQPGVRARGRAAP